MTTPKNIFITGGSGFIGTNLVRSFRSKGHSVKVFEGNLLDYTSLKSQVSTSEGWDFVIHLAAISSPVICERDPKLAYSVNVLGTSLLLEALKDQTQKKRPHIIFPSTAHVYALPTGGDAITENTPILIKNIYGETKIQAESIVEGFSKRNNLKATVLRLFNHAHITQSTDFLIPSLYHQIKELRSNEHQVFVGDLDLFRDIGTIPDLVLAFESILNSDRVDSAFEIINVCAGKSYHLIELAKHFAKYLSRTDVEFVTEKNRLRSAETKTIVGSYAKMTKLYGWEPANNEIKYFYKDLFQ